MPQAQPEFRIITAARLIDGNGGDAIPNAAVLLRGSKIESVGRVEDIRAPDGANVEIHDYPGMTIMPGMVDCHTHQNGFGDGRVGDDVALIPDEVLTLQSARNARNSLFSGITTFRENGPKNVTMFRLRDAVNEGFVQSPRMVLCGRPISIIGGHMGYFGTEVTGPVEAAAATRQLIKEGADYIKITATGGSTRTSYPLLPSFEPDELRAITREAQKFGRLTATHSSSTQGIVNSIDAEVDMIIHCVFKEADGTDNYREDVVERLAKSGSYINPTLHVGRARVWTLEHKKHDEGLSTSEQASLDNALGELDVKLDHSRRMIDAGLKVITGSDSSWGDYQLGNTIYETELLTIAGYSNMQGILSVTSDAAKSLGVDSSVGTLEQGKEADVVVIDGNPLDDINALWNVREVFFAGEIVDRGSEASLDAIRQPRGDT